MQNQSEQVHGLVGEAIPNWSRIYKGSYYESKIEAGWTISEEAERIAEEAYKDTENNTVEMAPRKKVEKVIEPVVAPVAPVAPTAPTKRKPKIVAKAAEPKPAEPKAAEPKPAEPKPAEPKVAEPEVVKKTRAKPQPKTQAKPPSSQTNTLIEPLNEDPTIITVKVRKIEIDNRIVYLNSLKDKVYDMRLNYLGRYNRKDNTIDITYADSDAE